MRHMPLILGLLLLIGSTPASALPAPMSLEELKAKSDIVAVVRVLSVSCTSIAKDKDTGEELPSYLARVRLVEVKKGDAKKGDELLITWRAVPKGIVGPWAVPYFPGEVVLTHLTKKSGGVSYGTTWWNGKGEDIKAPESTELPSKPGETLDAPKGESDEHPL